MLPRPPGLGKLDEETSTNGDHRRGACREASFGDAAIVKDLDHAVVVLDRLERPPGVAAGAGGLVHAALAATPCARPYPVDTRTGQAGDAPVGERVATGIARQYS